MTKGKSRGWTDPKLLIPLIGTVTAALISSLGTYHANPPEPQTGQNSVAAQSENTKIPPVDINNNSSHLRTIKQNSSESSSNQSTTLSNQNKNSPSSLPYNASSTSIQANNTITVSNNDKYASYTKGWALASQSSYEEAIQYFNKALLIDPKYKEAWNGKGWAHYHLGNYQEALSSFENALYIDPYYKDSLDGEAAARHSILMQQVNNIH